MTTPTPADRPAPRSTDRPTIGELVAGIAESTSKLVRDEIALAKKEMQEKAAKAGIGIGLFAAAGFVAFFAFGALVATLILAFATFLPAWLAGLVVTVLLLVIAGVLVLVGKKSLEGANPPTPERAVASVKEDIAAVRTATEGHRHV